MGIWWVRCGGRCHCLFILWHSKTCRLHDKWLRRFWQGRALLLGEDMQKGPCSGGSSNVTFTCLASACQASLCVCRGGALNLSVCIAAAAINSRKVPAPVWVTSAFMRLTSRHVCFINGGTICGKLKVVRWWHLLIFLWFFWAFLEIEIQPAMELIKFSAHT